MPRKTHPNARRNRDRRPIVVTQKVTTPEGHARQLVSKGLATVLILDNPSSYLVHEQPKG